MKLMLMLKLWICAFPNDQSVALFKQGKHSPQKLQRNISVVVYFFLLCPPNIPNSGCFGPKFEMETTGSDC